MHPGFLFMIRLKNIRGEIMKKVSLVNVVKVELNSNTNVVTYHFAYQNRSYQLDLNLNNYYENEKHRVLQALTQNMTHNFLSHDNVKANSNSLIFSFRYKLNGIPEKFVYVIPSSLSLPPTLSNLAALVNSNGLDEWLDAE
jgi:hypothetical protein